MIENFGSWCPALILAHAAREPIDRMENADPGWASACLCSVGVGAENEVEIQVAYPSVVRCSRGAGMRVAETLGGRDSEDSDEHEP